MIKKYFFLTIEVDLLKWFRHLSIYHLSIFTFQEETNTQIQIHTHNIHWTHLIILIKSILFKLHFITKSFRYKESVTYMNNTIF